MTLDISEEEAKVLRALLTRFIAETKSEIYHTEAGSYKKILRGEKEEAKQVLEKLQAKEVLH